MAREFDNLGLLVMHCVIPLDFVLDYYSRPLVQAWPRLKEYIICVRNERKQPGHMKMFKNLAIAAKKHRDKYHPREETFSISKEELHEYIEFRKYNATNSSHHTCLERPILEWCLLR